MEEKRVGWGNNTARILPSLNLHKSFTSHLIHPTPPSPPPTKERESALILQLKLPILALRIETGDLDIDSDLALHIPHVLIAKPDHTPLVRDPDGHLDAVALVVAEAVLLDDALDEFVHRDVAEEDGPVVDFGFGGADVDVEGCDGRLGVSVNKSKGRGIQLLLPGDLCGEGVLAR